MSRRTNLLVFDEYVPLSTTSANPVYTSTEFERSLALFDQIAIQVVIDNVTRSGGTAGFYLHIETSGNGRHFSQINNSGSPEVVFGASPGLSTTSTNVASGSYPGAVSSDGSLLGFVRFAIHFTEATTAAHVKVYVTQRDQAK
ncbi:MAG: hypothetical protein U0359_23570 [Byssovorax sp.]